jgi:CRISPR/Cas system-associated endonuclease Cas1
MMTTLILSENGSSLVLRGGKLVHWIKRVGLVESWDPAVLPFDRVSIECWGGSVTWPALRVLAEHKVPLSVLNFDGQVTTSALPAGGHHANDLIAQVRAHLDPQRRVEVARFVLSKKLGHEPPRSLQNLDELRLYEGREAERYWTAHGILREYPHAHDVRNAALNYGFGILESIVRTAVHRKGLDPTVGFLHVPREGKDSFVYDVMEPFRNVTVQAATGVHLTSRDAYSVFRIGLRLRPGAAKKIAVAVGKAVQIRQVEEFLRLLRLRFDDPLPRANSGDIAGTRLHQRPFD